jgi:acetolactate synthase-1/2/3 large subunit
MSIRRSLSTEVAVVDAVVNVLVEAGIDHVFGMPGGHTCRLFGALEARQAAIRTVLVREESLGGVMAEVAGRLSGKPGVLIGQGPWILGNGLIGIIEGYLSSSPMLLMTDFSDSPRYALHAPYQQGTGDYGGWDARQAFKGVTKQTFQVLEAGQAVQATQLAIKHALAGQPGPVGLLFSGRAWQGTVGPNTVPRIYPTAHYLSKAAMCPSRSHLAAAAEVIRESKAPAIIAGNGVRIAGAFDELRRFAEEVGAPVVTTATGKGCFPENHPLSLGTFGTFGTPIANGCVSEADVLVVIGSKLSASDCAWENPELIDPERQTIVQIDVEARNASWTTPCEHVVLGSAEIVLTELTPLCGGAAQEDVEGRLRSLRDRFAMMNTFPTPRPGDAMSPLTAIMEMRKALPDEAIVTCDAGENRILMMHCFQTRSADSFLMAAGAGPMGYAIPAALAAKLLRPNRPVVAVSGDGGFAMTMNGLLTAVEQNIPIISVIFNNSVLGWSMHVENEFANSFKDFNYARIAEAMGCNAYRIEQASQIGPAIAEALNAGVPCVLDIVTSHEITFKNVTSPFSVKLV